MLSSSIIIHSDIDLKKAIHNTKAPKNIVDSLVIVNVEYYNFDEKLCKGQIIVNKAVEKDIIDCFVLIKELKFPIEKVVPIVNYNWSDDKSMADNNTSAFNYRTIAGTSRLSNHSTGRAIDFNPVQNPAVYANGRISPKGAKYNKLAKGTLTPDSKIVAFFKERGWRWGGDWTSLKDYQHFDKP